MFSSLVCSSPPGLASVCFGAAIPVACGSIYKSFAQCLLTLGDSLVDTQKDQSTQDIDAICRCVLHLVCVINVKGSVCRNWLHLAMKLQTATNWNRAPACQSV